MDPSPSGTIIAIDRPCLHVREEARDHYWIRLPVPLGITVGLLVGYHRDQSILL